MKSIRIRIIILLLLGLGGLCGGGGWLAYRAIRNTLLGEFDYALKTKVNDLFILAKREHDGGEMRLAEWLMPEFDRAEYPEYFQIRNDGGEIIAQSASMGKSSLSLPGERVTAEPVVYDVTLPSGIPGRAAAIQMKVRTEEHHGEHQSRSFRESSSITIILARNTQRLTQLFMAMGVGFASGTAVLLFLMALAIKLVVKAGLQPLDTLAKQAMEIHPENLAARFPVGTMPEELRPIAQQLNQLLERISAAFQRERYLTAAMAHELYTPIAELRSLAEVAQKWPEDHEATANVVPGAHAIALQMQDLVNALLFLSRCESGLQEVEMQPVDMSGVVATIRSQIEAQLNSKQIQSDWSLDPSAQVITDRTMLTAVLMNILKNAAEYVPEQGEFRCRVEAADGGCSITVSNSNSTLVAEDLEHLFEPMWRKDKARTGSAHSGLGLSVVEQFCKLLGIQLSASLPEPDQFQITLFIPATMAG